MTLRKADNLLRGDRTPAYVDRETGAAELLISPDTWDQWVKEGRLPLPGDTFPSGTPRWRWEDVDRMLSGKKASDTDAAVWGQRTLARRRESGVTLPEGVEKTTVRKKNGKVYTYYYWNPHRGTEREGERIKLPNADTSPKAFWAEVERRQSSAPTAYPAGSIGDLIARYRSSDEFKRLAEGTQCGASRHSTHGALWRSAICLHSP